MIALICLRIKMSSIIKINRPFKITICTKVHFSTAPVFASPSPIALARSKQRIDDIARSASYLSTNRKCHKTSKSQTPVANQQYAKLFGTN